MLRIKNYIKNMNIKYFLYNKNLREEFISSFYLHLNNYLPSLQSNCADLIIYLRYGEFYQSIIDLAKTNTILYKWYENTILLLLKKCFFINKIQFQWRKYKIKDIRNFVNLPSVGKIHMINYAVLHDTRSLMLTTLNDEIKLKFSPWAWLIGIQKDIRVYKHLPEKIKEHEEIGYLIGKFYINRIGGLNSIYSRDVPINIRKKIEENNI